MSNPEHVKLVRQGAGAIGTWRTAHPHEIFDLVGADLQGSQLEGAGLQRAKLQAVDLGGVNLRGAQLQRADLQEAQLQGAFLAGADLQEANLQEANLTRAILDMANLIWAVLDGAILTDASLWETQRAGWSIHEVVCEAVYWNRRQNERTTYAPGEFERLYADKTKIILWYEGGIHPIEIATLPALIHQMEVRYPGCVLRLRSIEDGPGGATVTLGVDDPGDVVHTKIEALKAELQQRGQALIIAERATLEAQNQREKAEYALRYLSHEVLPSLVRNVQPKYAIRIEGGGPPMIGDTQGDIYHVPGQAGAIGGDSHAHDMTFIQLWNQSRQSIDLPALAADLATLRQHLRQAAVEAEHDVAMGAIAQAEIAAKEGNGPKALEWLRQAGQWALDNATKIGVAVATEALKKALD